jgi:glycosyltransferase involved in cell wall biosynthesis
MNIVFYGPSPFPDGYATSKRRLAYIRYLVDCTKTDCKVIVTRHNSFDLFKNPVTISEEHLYYRDLSPDYKKSPAIYIFSLLKCIRKSFQKNQRNILILTTFITKSSLLILPYAKMLGYKIVFDKTEHILVRKTDTGRLKYFIIRIIDYLLVVFSDGIIVISSFLQNYYKNIKKNILLLPNSVSVKEIKPDSPGSGTIRILFSGTFDEKNGPHLLLNAVNKLNICNYDVELFITGLKDQNFYAKQYEIFQDKNFIHFMGFVDDGKLNQLISDSDILTMTRIDSTEARFGFPYKLSEALAYGKPILCTDVGDVKLYVEHLHDVFLIKPNDAESVFEGLKELIDNKLLRNQLSENAIKTAKKHFDVSVNGNNLLNFLQKI